MAAKNNELMVMDMPHWPDPDDGPLARRFRELERENAQLRDDLAVARAETTAARADADRAERAAGRAVANLRKQLGPLHEALKMVFGEIDAIAPEAEAAYTGTPTPDSREQKIWDSWKSRMPGRCAQIIDALLLQPGMNQTQISVAIGCHRNSVPDLIHKLKKAGLIQKQGDKYSLVKL